jgi:hypothetical protein
VQYGTREREQSVWAQIDPLKADRREKEKIVVQRKFEEISAKMEFKSVVGDE